MKINEAKIYKGNRLEGFLLESPLYDPCSNSIYFTDIEDCKIYCLRSNTLYCSEKLISPVTAICKHPSLGVVGVSTGEIYNIVVDKVDYKLNLVLILRYRFDPPILFSSRTNDVEIDMFGNFWIGVVDIPPAPDTGSVYFLSPYQNIAIKKMEAWLPNGMVWINASSFLFADTRSRTIEKISISSEKKIVSRNVWWLCNNAVAGNPDGMTLSGNLLYVALWGGSAVACVEIEKQSNEGLYRGSIPLPFKYPSSVCTIQKGLKTTLVITSADADGKATIWFVSLNEFFEKFL